MSRGPYRRYIAHQGESLLYLVIEEGLTAKAGAIETAITITADHIKSKKYNDDEERRLPFNVKKTAVGNKDEHFLTYISKMMDVLDRSDIKGNYLVIENASNTPTTTRSQRDSYSLGSCFRGRCGTLTDIDHQKRYFTNFFKLPSKSHIDFTSYVMSVKEHDRHTLEPQSHGPRRNIMENLAEVSDPTP